MKFGFLTGMVMMIIVAPKKSFDKIKLTVKYRKLEEASFH